MAQPAQLQEILGVDKYNPVFTLCADPQQPGKLLVYFGMSLLEVLDNDPTSPAFKLLLARLYNAGVKPQSLLKTFPIAYTSLRRWAAALKSGDHEKLIAVLAGHQHPRKLTPEILSFSHARFDAIYPENPYSYSKVIRQEIMETFGESISGESLRPYFAQWMRTLNAASTDRSPRNGESRQDNGLSPDQEGTSHERNDPILTTTEEKNNPELGQAIPPSPVPTPVEENNRKHTVVLIETDSTPEIVAHPNDGYQFCHHAGVLLFSGFLNSLSGIKTGGIFIKQCLVAILLGAVNIEQSKLLHYPSLGRFLGETISNLHQQRQRLSEMAQTSSVDELHQMNGQWVGISQCRDFYYDPHSKHYTGMNKLLKGWCSRLRFAEKVLHMDFIHTPTGEPVYLYHDDNYQDLRERFFHVVRKFRLLFNFSQSIPLTFVLDRGIYGIDTFKQFLSGDSKNHFITWEKGFRADRHKDIQWNGSISLYRAKNSSKDLKRYHFSYCDTRWSRDNNIRCLLVKATNPKGNSITVSILASDLLRCAEGIITLMFDRWIQENDFKYLDVHFGINEITSYATLSYKDIEQTLIDKQEKSGVYKALEKQRFQLKAQLKTQLLNEHRAKNKSSKRQEKIVSLTQQLNELEEKMAQTEKEASRLQALTEQGFRKLNTGNKSMMDGIKILARNGFYEHLRPFKQAYDNYRDDHMLFRHLTRSSGLIRDRGDCIEVLLIPQACFSPKVTTIFNTMLEKINHSQPCMPDGSGRRISLHLLQNNKTLFDVTPTLEPGGTSKRERLAIGHVDN